MYSPKYQDVVVTDVANKLFFRTSLWETGRRFLKCMHFIAHIPDGQCVSPLYTLRGRFISILWCIEDTAVNCICIICLKGVGRSTYVLAIRWLFLQYHPVIPGLNIGTFCLITATRKFLHWFTYLFAIPVLAFRLECNPNSFWGPRVDC